MSNRFRPKYNIKKGDQVVIIAGDDKDLKKPRTVLEVIHNEEGDGRVVVEGANIITRHTKPSAQNTKGGIVKREASVNISNVMLWDAKAGSATKVKRDRKEGKLVRIAKKSGEVIIFAPSTTTRPSPSSL
ncbi:MAG: LSU ribosomal protein L24p (L26e) [uncultured Segetibacter sp.]|uniref:Large ribosomal subunit protein uL24 n=1 Tax=uncultured Segetibacter sp. TaxID=481133 RepID=A0A6J4SJT1_9BACT|nr:MAG: LSU ribosomal protein L24p (L26e) [uncultured Segetibacter sp.]